MKDGAQEARLVPRLGFLLVAVSILSSITLMKGGWGVSDWLYAGLLAVHAAAGVLILARRDGRIPRGASEALFTVTGIFFLFIYVYAANANMDYVQRFAAFSGRLRLAPNTLQERLSAAVRFVPLLAVDLALCILAVTPGVKRMKSFDGVVEAWGLPLSILSGVLYALAFPSFLDANGIPALGFICLIPLFLVLPRVGLGRGIFYGTVFGLVQSLLINYWLGTFDLVSLQFQTVVSLVEYLPFMTASLLLLKLAGRSGAGRRFSFLVFPACWTLFDYLRSLGFLGYPWGMLGTSQYQFIPLIQTASVTGVWGVTFIVTLFNSVAAEATGLAVGRRRVRALSPAVLGVALAAALVFGAVRISTVDAALGSPQARTVRVALVQQNGDPRKDDYRADFDTLVRLTNQALQKKPELVAWSETAFVPNIRRWSQVDPASDSLAALVHDFLEYQKSIRTWLITGNDDYLLAPGPEGMERTDYNASVLFSPQGERAMTYHKIHLVPFTEYFPYTTQLPGISAMLQSFDIHLWEPGTERVVFRIPGMAFSTPICFEDVFPSDVRGFVRAGANAILNLTNDYWSLTDAEAMQHAVDGLFRAVENGVPLARAAASGLTCVVDPLGRITARAPLYQQAFLVADVKIPPARPTLYTRWGDWFPAAMGLLAASIAAMGLIGRRRKSGAA